MSLLNPNGFHFPTLTGNCHVCGRPVDMHDVAVAHDGDVGLSVGENSPVKATGKSCCT